MSEFSNPATRVLSCIQKVVQASDTETAAEVWANTLGVDKNKSKNDPHDVTEKLGLLRKQVDLIESSMKLTQFSESLYRPHLGNIRRTITVNNIMATWGTYKVQLTAEAILSLRFCSEILDKETPLSMDELESLLAKIASLREEIEVGSLDGSTANFILGQLNIIETAIRDYPISGGYAIKQAFRDGFSDLTDHAENMSENEGKESKNKLGGIWTDLKSAGGELVEADKMAKAYVGLIEKGQAFTEAVMTLPFMNV